MQLQAERDNFVQAGIGGSASSPTTDSPLSLLSIGSLKKPRAKKTKGIPPPPPPKQAPLTSASAPVHVDEPAVEKSSSTEAFNSSLPLHLPVPLSLSLSLASPVSLVSPQDQSLPTTTVQHAHLISDQSDDAILTNAETTGSTTQSELTAASTGNHRLLEESDILSRFPFELLIVILSNLDALDLSRVAQANRHCLGIINDEAIWRIKSREHPLFSGRLEHFAGCISGATAGQQMTSRPWLSLFKFLHKKSLVVKDNWSRARPEAVYVLEGHTGLISSLEMSIWTLVTASTDSTIRVWDLRTMQCTQVLHSKQSLTCVSQSERAVCARTSFGGLCIWDIQTGKLVMQDDTAMPHIASFIYMDDTHIGYGQCDGMVTVFDWSSRTHLEVVGSYQAHEGDVIHISILDRKHVISASTSGETLVYSLPQARILERILLPHATQAIQFTPTIHDDKVMFSTRDAVYEYELMLGYLSSGTSSTPPLGQKSARPGTRVGKRQSEPEELQQDYSIGSLVDSQLSLSIQGPMHGDNSSPRDSKVTASPLALSTRSTPPAGRIWKNSNSLLSQIRQRVGTDRVVTTDSDRPYIPTRFPRLASLCCLPRTSRSLDHGTTSARDSYGVFLPLNCTRLCEISIYTRATKQIRQIHGPAVDRVLEGAIRNPFYTTMECNQHCAVVSSGSKVYVISFLPPEL